VNDTHRPGTYVGGMPKVLLNFRLYGNAWTVHFIQVDCRTTIGPRTRYFNFPALDSFRSFIHDTSLRMRPSPGSITASERGAEAASTFN
jgi:hypothetical protein